MLLHGERGTRLFRGTAYTAVVALLGDGRSIDDIVEAASREVSAAEVHYVLDRLEKCGAIRERDDSLPPSAAQFWDALGVAPGTAARALAEARITLVDLGTSVADPLAQSLASLGIGVAPHGTFSITLTDDYLRPELAGLNEARLRDGKPWLVARPAGSILWIGPLFRPGVTACWTCMAHRMRTQRVAERFVQRHRNDAYPRTPAGASLPSTVSAAASLIATEVAKWLAGTASPELETTLLTIDFATLATERHPVVRRPQCSACGTGDRAESAPEPIRLRSRAKGFTADGGFRSQPPEVTLARYGSLVSPLTGVVSHLRDDSSVDPVAAPLCSSGRNASRIDDSIESLRGRFRSGSGGKGKTAQQAKAGALAEAIERYSGVFDGSEPRFRATLESLGAAAIHPNDCMLYSDAQYARHTTSATASRSYRVPEIFDPAAEVEWSALWSLTHDRVRHLPTAYCYYDYGAPFCWADSNGCAAGNSLEEAILQGFLEVVERDCVAVWWYNRLTRPAVDLDSFDEPYLAEVRRYYRSLHRDLWVLDLTSDFGIPAFAAVSRRTDMAADDITLGFGCHLDPRLGILRAVTEANQFLPVVIGRKNEDSPFDTTSDEILDWLKQATLEAHPYLVPSAAPQRRSSDYKRVEHADLKDDVETCVRLAAERGLETLVLDQTRPDIGLPVVRVVVPGMRHFWERLAPGRLYDVPVAMGWLPAPLRESELNPVAVFF